MYGFVAGSLVLIGMYVAFQPGGARAAEQGGNWAVQGLRRLMSPGVAGIPQRGAAATQRQPDTISGGVTLTHPWDQAKIGP